MELVGYIKGINRDLVSGQYNLTIETKNVYMAGYEKLKGKEIDVEINQHREKRSLNANNYAWKLITELGNVMQLSKEEVYFIKLKQYGQSQMISVLDTIDVSKFLKYYEEAGETVLNDRLFKHYKVYTGTSEYNSKEMSIFIHGVVEDCKEQGIETKTPAELEQMCEEWGK